MPRAELKTFIFSAGSKYLSFNNAVMVPVPKRIPFTMVKNAHLICTMGTNRYKFQHYDISDFSLFVNGKHFPNEGLSLGINHEMTSNAGHQIHTIYL